MPTELADEAAAGPEDAGHSGDDLVGPGHPMERGVAEDGVELALEVQVMPIGQPYFETTPPGGVDHVGCGIHTHDRGPGRLHHLGQGTVPASEVENALTGPG